MLSENLLVTARRCIESTYDGLCDLVEFGDKTDPITQITSKHETVVAEKIPCRISFEKTVAAAQTDAAAAVLQTIKLFIAPEVRITEGTKMIVTQNGNTSEYSLSGKPAVYATHQEIILEMFRGWA